VCQTEYTSSSPSSLNVKEQKIKNWVNCVIINRYWKNRVSSVWKIILVVMASVRWNNDRRDNESDRPVCETKVDATKILNDYRADEKSHIASAITSAKIKSSANSTLSPIQPNLLVQTPLMIIQWKTHHFFLRKKNLLMTCIQKFINVQQKIRIHLITNNHHQKINKHWCNFLIVWRVGQRRKYTVANKTGGKYLRLSNSSTIYLNNLSQLLVRTSLHYIPT